MKHTAGEESILSKVNEIGMDEGALNEENLVFLVLEPYLNKLTTLLKKSTPDEIYEIFMKYKGVMNVMKMIEDEAKKMEQELGLI